MRVMGSTTAAEETTAVTGGTAAAGPAAEAERERLQREIRERLVVSFAASRTRRQDNPWFEHRVAAMVTEARLFMRYQIPWWPPRLLIRKLVRSLVAPIFAPQVEFNEAVRDILMELRQRSEAQTAAHQEALQTVLRLEAEVEEMAHHLRAAQRRLAAVERGAADLPDLSSLRYTNHR